MDKTTKIILGVCLGVIVLCVFAAIAGMVIIGTTGSNLFHAVNTEGNQVGEVVKFDCRLCTAF